MSNLFDLETAPQPAPLPTHLRRLVLVVDDDPIQLEILEYHLQKLQYEVLKFDRAAPVLETARKQLPDLILLDIQLPDASGLDVCAQLVDDPATSSIPVVIVSGSDDPEVVRAARKAGCRFFLRKPYDPNILVLIADHSIQDSDRWMV